MIKHFCDMCEAEITPKNAPKGAVGDEAVMGAVLKRRGLMLGVDVVLKPPAEGAEAGEFCKYCILDALYKLDDRPETPEASA